MKFSAKILKIEPLRAGIRRPIGKKYPCSDQDIFYSIFKWSGFLRKFFTFSINFRKDLFSEHFSFFQSVSKRTVTFFENTIYLSPAKKFHIKNEIVFTNRWSGSIRKHIAQIKGLAVKVKIFEMLRLRQRNFVAISKLYSQFE